MTLLDRFRTQSRDKHSDPAVRLAFVEELPLEERATIAAVAREDEDPRVRRAAVAKLMAPDDLASVARDDADESVRAQALTMLREIALEAFEGIGETESLSAVDVMSDARSLAQVAKTSVNERVAVRALARLDDPRLLGSIARHAVIGAVRLSAADAVRARGDRSELLAMALNSDFKDTAVVAVEAITDRLDLEMIITRSRNKSAAKRAQAIVREADELTARQAAEAAAAATEALIAAHIALPEPEADTATPPHGDPLAAQLESGGTAQESETDHQAVAAAGPLEDVQPAERAREQAEVDAARDEAATGEAAAGDVEQRHARLAELAVDAAAAAAEEFLPVARKRFAAVAKEWRGLSEGLTLAPEVLGPFAESERRLAARDAESREADARARRDALARVHGLLTRVEPLAAKPDLTLKAAERAVRDVKAALGAMPPLPSKQDFEDVSARLKAAHATLVPKVQELREADDWKRFANASVQEQLCAKMEALKAVDDPDVIAKQVKELQEQWRESADVPRAQADQLWRRFKTAHDEVWARCESHFAAQAQERAGNLAKKLALCEKAETLAESSKWIQTAEEIKQLQAEWKTIGPVSRGREKAVWDRFRAACDRFFTRRHDDMALRRSTWDENLAKKDALCVRAEALAESSEWEASAAEIKKLQAEWKTIGPVKKTKSDAIWQRFRAACDRFFARYATRHDTARAERIGAREAICAELEACALGDEARPDLLATVRAIRLRWQQEVGARGVDPDQARALDERFAAASAAAIGRWPAAFAGTDLDPDANLKRMETLVKRVEDLALSLNGSAAVDARLSPTNRLAVMLKEALAANTIGGKADDEARFRAAAEEVKQAQASWSRIGSVPEEPRRQLTSRFQRACRTISERAGAARPAASPGSRRTG